MELTVKGLDDLKIDFTNYGKFNNTAVSNALNKTGTIATNVSLRKTRGQGWNMLAGEFKKLADVKKSKKNTLHYTFAMTSKSISLMKFKGTEYIGTFSESRIKGAKGTVIYKLKGKGRRKPLAKSFVMASKFNNHAQTVFTRRKSPFGANITAQYSITPSSMFQQEGEEAFIDTFMTKFEKIYYNQLEYKKII